MSIEGNRKPKMTTWRRRIMRRGALVWLSLALLCSLGCARTLPPTVASPTRTPVERVCGTTVSGAISPAVKAEASQARKPLVYGVNLAMYDTTDNVVNERSVQALLRTYQVPVIRMPFRPTLTDAYETQALQAIRDIGALPLVIIHGPTDSSVLTDDMHIITLVRNVFGDSAVYVEYGNESELDGVSAEEYAASWNRVVPCLKSIAPQYQFIGPAASFFNPSYITRFDQLAQPRPDFNSWHEYACSSLDNDDMCMTNVKKWKDHIAAMEKATTAAIGVRIPIMLTEWNLDGYSDARFSNSAFMHSWMSVALDTLAASRADGLYAAMQYCVTNNPNLSLIDSANAFTPAGQEFFNALKQASTS